jgi:RIO-like serine/threonine protein kinase
MVDREFRALMKLRGIPGVPSSVFLLDRYALCYHFIPGTILRDVPADRIRDDFFLSLEQLVMGIHKKGLVHLDLRNQRNILMTDDGNPALLDFQSSINLKKTPRFLRKLFKDIDLSGVYKNWGKKIPESLDSTRKSRLDTINRKRFLWFLKGYPFGTRKRRRAI